MIFKAAITAMIAAFIIKSVFIFSPPFRPISPLNRVCRRECGTYPKNDFNIKKEAINASLHYPCADLCLWMVRTRGMAAL